MTGGLILRKTGVSARHGARVLRGALLLALSAALLSGCGPEVSVQGLVYNLQNEPLPGVSVRVETLGAFSVSNGNGVFGRRPNTLGVPPGEWELTYFKTGFTTARQTIQTGEGRLLEVQPVQLWPLPSGKGVYALNGLRYESFTRANPERHVRPNNTPVYGTKIEPELALSAAPELIISHRMATYDWQLSRLEPLKVLREGVEAASTPEPDTDKKKSDKTASDDSRTEEIWAAAVRLPIQAVPIDEPEQELWRITPSVELGPGLYAIHWGAFDGDMTTEPVAYLLRIIDPNAPVEPEPTEDGAKKDEEEEDTDPALDEEMLVDEEAPFDGGTSTDGTTTEP